MENSSLINSIHGSIAILGCGWLGERIGKAFLEKEWVVRVSSRSEKRLEELSDFGFESFQIDIEDGRKLSKDFLAVDYLIIATTNKNSDAHQRLVKQIQNCFIKKVFFISSTSVYAPTEDVITEDSPLIDSLLVEVENEYRSLDNYMILRCGGLIGDNRQPGNFFKKGARIKNPNGMVKLIHFKEVISHIESLLENEVEQKVYNLFEESQLSRYEFYSKAYEELHGESGEFK